MKHVSKLICISIISFSTSDCLAQNFGVNVIKDWTSYVDTGAGPVAGTVFAPGDEISSDGEFELLNGTNTTYFGIWEATLTEKDSANGSINFVVDSYFFPKAIGGGGGKYGDDPHVEFTTLTPLQTSIRYESELDVYFSTNNTAATASAGQVGATQVSRDATFQQAAGGGGGPN